jgi:hypothetical protein
MSGGWQVIAGHGILLSGAGRSAAYLAKIAYRRYQIAHRDLADGSAPFRFQTSTSEAPGGGSMAASIDASKD